MRIFFYLYFYITFCFFSYLSAGELKIYVKNIKNNIGSIHYALYDDPKYFPKQEGRILGGNKNINEVLIEGISIKNLREAFYAVAIYHDENSNKKFDTFLSLPTERYGFSNNAPIFLGPPKFNDASFFVSRNNIIEIQIELR